MRKPKPTVKVGTLVRICSDIVAHKRGHLAVVTSINASSTTGRTIYDVKYLATGETDWWFRSQIELAEEQLS